MKGRYIQDISIPEKQKLEEKIKEILLIKNIDSTQGTKNNIGSLIGKYEFTSLFSKIKSALSIPEKNLSSRERIALRLYGRFGVVINNVQRNLLSNQKVPMGNKTLENQEGIFDSFLTNYKINDRYDIGDVKKKPSMTKEEEEKLKIKIKNNNIIRDEITKSTLLSNSITTIIDNLIDKHYVNSLKSFTTDEFLYRISRAKQHIYSDKGEEYINTIHLGDIIMDTSLLSSTISQDAALYRYSSYADKGSASNKKQIAAGEEEILYMIKKNSHIKAVDISSYKFNFHDPDITSTRKKELLKSTSGEFLIKSLSLFKVIGIQNDKSNVLPRIVFLEPISNDSLNKKDDIIKNLFDASPIDYNFSYYEDKQKVNNLIEEEQAQYDKFEHIVNSTSKNIEDFRELFFNSELKDIDTYKNMLSELNKNIDEINGIKTWIEKEEEEHKGAAIIFLDGEFIDELKVKMQDITPRLLELKQKIDNKIMIHSGKQSFTSDDEGRGAIGGQEVTNQSRIIKAINYNYNRIYEEIETSVIMEAIRNVLGDISKDDDIDIDRILQQAETRIIEQSQEEYDSDLIAKEQIEEDESDRIAREQIEEEYQGKH